MPTLTLGTTKFVIQSLVRAGDGSIAVPADKPGVAYWIEGTNVRCYEFFLCPDIDRLRPVVMPRATGVAERVRACLTAGGKSTRTK